MAKTTPVARDGVWARSCLQIGYQALTQSALGEYHSALALHAEEQRLAETLEDPAAIAVLLANQAHLWGVKPNQKTEALQLLDRAFALAREHGMKALCDRILETRSNIEQSFE